MAILLLLSCLATLTSQEGVNKDIREAMPRKPLDHLNTDLCEKFLNGTTFEPSSIMNIDWYMYYATCPVDSDVSRSIYKFSVPKSAQVTRFKNIFIKDTKYPVNWSDTRMHMEGSTFSGLYFPTNVSGIYRLLPTIFFEVKDTEPLLIGFKKIDDHISTMYCFLGCSFLMAPLDKVPTTTEEAEKIAAKFEFGIQGHLFPDAKHLPPLPDLHEFNEDYVIADETDVIET